MARVGCPVVGGIIRFCVARSTFSGIEKNVSILCLREKKEIVMDKVTEEERGGTPTSHASLRWCP